jgi:phosphoribosyl 1,2-cyclic phosphate phosphodiesterase
MKVTMLGSGPSWGVPRIGGDWGACDPAESKNRRRRVSILVEDAGKTILIDTGPDLREQLLDAKVTRIDAVLFTHAHADHLHGIDDLRQINRLMQAEIPVYATKATLADIDKRFGYVFQPPKPGIAAFYKPVLRPIAIDGAFSAAGMDIVPIRQNHGFSETLGFRFGRFAYSTDAHSHVERTLGWIARVGAKRAVLTHMDESMDYRSLRADLPKGVEPGYDGMVLEIAE